jgi:hypothetical protein
MELRLDYTVTGSMKAIFAKVKPKIMLQLERLIQGQVDDYLNDLEKHMGSITGDKPFSDNAVHWDALDEKQLEESPRFWIESGKAKRSVAVNLQVNDNSIKAFVGVSEGSEGYQDVLWNELGFTPKNGDKLIRRPLFIPLAELHIAELKGKIKGSMTKMTINVGIK